TQFTGTEHSNPYEKKFGYCRAVKRGSFIFVSGTTAIDVDTGRALKEILGDVGLPQR
ncbi:hypothetical protein BU15DRAFT_57230, partial [Melanogaster broomeanus]